MKPALRVMLCDDAGERFFGEGPCRLLHLIEETGSLRSAAAQMGLSYSKALRLVQHAEKELGFALTCKTIGGRGGGGSTLTAEWEKPLLQRKSEKSQSMHSGQISGKSSTILVWYSRISTYSPTIPFCGISQKRPGSS